MKDNVIVETGKKWEFNEEVASVFDEMLERSIPQYELMRDLTYKLGSKYVQRLTSIVDLGCSNGIALEPFVRRFGACNNYKMYDVSEPMLEKCREKYNSWIENGLAEVSNLNISSGIPTTNASLVLSILTLQFTPIEYRHKIVKSVYNSLKSGGAFILVEKVLGNTSEIDDAFVEQYYQMKSEHQYTQEQIINKRKSLEGVLVPITARWNEDLLKESGFKQIDCFWRCLNFAGWIAIK